MKVNYLVAHCTGGPQNQTLDEILKYWKNVEKWRNPGYHFLIMPDGTEHHLMDESKPTNGVRGYNSQSIHICYVGGVDNKGKFADTRTSQQKATMLRRFKLLREKYPNAKIRGHRDFSPDTNKNGKVDKWEWIKFCPGFDAQDEYKDLNP